MWEACNHYFLKARDEGKVALWVNLDEIAEKRKALQAQRKKLTGELRNETRKRQRIRKRSQYLTDEDLVEVLAMRETKKVASEAKAATTKREGPAPADKTKT